MLWYRSTLHYISTENRLKCKKKKRRAKAQLVMCAEHGCCVLYSCSGKLKWNSWQFPPQTGSWHWLPRFLLTGSADRVLNPWYQTQELNHARIAFSELYSKEMGIGDFLGNFLKIPNAPPPHMIVCHRKNKHYFKGYFVSRSTFCEVIDFTWLDSQER